MTSVYSLTRKDLRRQIMRFLSQPEDYRAGTATSGGMISLADTKMAPDAANYWAGAQLYVPTLGEARRVGSFGSNTLYFVPTLPVAVASGYEYELCKDFRIEEVHDALDRAIMEVAHVMLTTRVDTTLTKYTDEYRYSVPSGFVYLAEVWYKDYKGTGATYDKWEEVDPLHWDILLEASGPVLALDHDYDWTDVNGKALRLVGQVPPARLTEDTATVPVNPEWAIQHAVMNLAAKRATVSDERPEQFQRMHMLARQAVERLRPLMYSPPLPGSKKVMEV